MKGRRGGVMALQGPERDDEGFRRWLAPVVATIALVFFVVVFLSSLAIILHNHADPAWAPLQTMELYFAAAGAFLVVTAFKTMDGPMKLDMGIFKFEGSSGPIIMWIFVFMSLCLGMKTLGFPQPAPLSVDSPAAITGPPLRHPPA